MRSSRLLVSVLITTQLAYGGAFIMPMLVGALIDGRGLDPAAAGLLGSGELLGLALAAIALALTFMLIWRDSIRWRWLGGLLCGFAVITEYRTLGIACVLAAISGFDGSGLPRCRREFCSKATCKCRSS